MHSIAHPEIELVRLGEHRGFELVDVVAAVVGHDGDEGVDVGEELRQQRVGEGNRAHTGAPQQEEGKRHQHKVVQPVGGQHLRKTQGRRGTEGGSEGGTRRGAAPDSTKEGGCSRRVRGGHP
eukprot:5585272-Pyramimonas_sp.AAC.1